MTNAILKSVYFLTILLILSPISSYSQVINEPVGQCFVRGNRKSIEKKMNNLLNRVSVEMNCPIDSITYTIIDKYTGFYTKECRHLPKVVNFNGCGNVQTYYHNGLSGAVLYWILGSWVQKKS
jgi:hypothetical protein